VVASTCCLKCLPSNQQVGIFQGVGSPQLPPPRWTHKLAALASLWVQSHDHHCETSEAYVQACGEG
jgi:hypothetical protein